MGSLLSVVAVARLERAGTPSSVKRVCDAYDHPSLEVGQLNVAVGQTHSLRLDGGLTHLASTLARSSMGTLPEALSTFYDTVMHSVQQRRKGAPSGSQSLQQ